MHKDKYTHTCIILRCGDNLHEFAICFGFYACLLACLLVCLLSCSFSHDDFSCLTDTVYLLASCLPACFFVLVFVDWLIDHVQRPYFTAMMKDRENNSLQWWEGVGAGRGVLGRGGGGGKNENLSPVCTTKATQSIKKAVQGARKFPDPSHRCLFVGYLTSQQHARVSQGRICSEMCTCCHTEIEVADQTFISPIHSIPTPGKPVPALTL